MQLLDIISFYHNFIPCWHWWCLCLPYCPCWDKVDCESFFNTHLSDCRQLFSRNI